MYTSNTKMLYLVNLLLETSSTANEVKVFDLLFVGLSIRVVSFCL